MSFTTLRAIGRLCHHHPYGLVPEVGFEPTLSCEKRILSPLRLPLRHSGKCRASAEAAAEDILFIYRVSFAVRCNDSYLYPASAQRGGPVVRLRGVP